MMYDRIGVENISLSSFGRRDFAICDYTYLYYRSFEHEFILLDELRSFLIYLLRANDKAIVRVVDSIGELSIGDTIQAENCAVSLHVEGGPAEFLVAGTSQPCMEEEKLILTRAAELYKVRKPWGYELWFNNQHPCYALKQIHIKSGQRTSLQYHRHKRETSVLFEGHAKLHYKHNKLIANDCVTPGDITPVDIFPVSSVDIIPNTLHRLEAVSDIILYEASTPHLDDVIRVQDDTQRPNGRISHEHEK